ncbi:MAG TPA: O-methyltransferase [Saprospiraceae bacterium]|nr:O-methyltransferase [Saprospiraceae bacterium]HNT20975.1 O-methyltransferase [Saprospiraceae bacterium]
MDKQIFGQVDQYISDLLLPPDPVLDDTLKSIENAGLPAISVSPVQGRFLQLMVLLTGARRILELGTLGGYSTICLARALTEKGRLISLELDPRCAEVARGNINKAGLGAKVEIRVGKALDLLPGILASNEGPFDLIFIDADKPPYAEYFDYAVKLSRPGTLIICDNVIREGKVLDPRCEDELVQGVQRFNKALARDHRVTATLFQTIGAKEHDGMALAVVK